MADEPPSDPPGPEPEAGGVGAAEGAPAAGSKTSPRAVRSVEAEEEGWSKRQRAASMPKAFAAPRVSLDYRALLPERFEVEVERRYVLDKLLLGEGGYGKVFVARDSKFDNRLVAVKKVTKTSCARKNEAYQAEIRIMKELDHPSICKLYETFEQGRHLFFVLEFCDGGELFAKIVEQGHISEPIAADIAGQVASGLRYAHSKSIAHRDIKPENLVFCTKDPNDTRVKIIDWGLSIDFSGEVMRTAVGSFAYAAPEVIMSRSMNAYTSACDTWSLGVVAYVMLCGKPPFWGSPQQHLQNARAEQYPLASPPWDKMSHDAKDFVRKLLRADPAHRLTSEEAMNHPWVASKDTPVDAECTKQVIRHLQQFMDHTLFMQLCITAVAHQLDHESLREIHQVFRDIDKNGDGTLSVEEIADGFKRIFGEDSAECKQVGDIFARLDLDGSGAVDYTEFCAAGLGESAATKADVVWAAFKAFDLDDSGKLSKAEIEKVLGSADVRNAWPPEVCERIAREVLEHFDADGDGEIAFDEWMQAIQGAWTRRHEGLGDSKSEAKARMPTHMGEAYEALVHDSHLGTWDAGASALQAKAP